MCDHSYLFFPLNWELEYTENRCKNSLTAPRGENPTAYLLPVSVTECKQNKPTSRRAYLLLLVET